MIFVEVAVAAPLPQTLTYSIGSELYPAISPASRPELIGRRVLVPLGSRRMTGYIVAIIAEEPEDFTVKAVVSFLDDSPLFHENIVDFFHWAAHYYQCPPGLVIKAALPGGLTTKSAAWLSLASTGEQGCTDAISMQEMNDRPPWLDKIIARGKLSPAETSAITGNRNSKKLLNALLTKGIVQLNRTLQGDAIQQKTETVFTPQRKDIAPDTSVDETRSHLAAYQRSVQIKTGISISYSEARALYSIFRTTAQNKKTSATLPELRQSYPHIGARLKTLQRKNLVVSQEKRIFRTPFGNTLAGDEDKPPLTPQQNTALQEIEEALAERAFAPFLLHGVTGSGKTEVYLQAAEKTLGQGRDVLLLVPEIALATQLEAQLLARFGDQVAILHSGMGRPEKFDQFSLALAGKVKIVIGARSAIFAPLADPGLIIVDEEHDGAYKQDDTFRYNGRDLALVRGKLQRSVVLLGSATPSVTSFANAQQGKYRLLTMPSRIGERELPRVTVVNLNMEAKKQQKSIIAELLAAKLRTNLAHGKQSILLLNRRGFSTAMLCQDCGTPVMCNHCHVSLTLHRRNERLICHYCGFSTTAKTTCGECRSMNLYPVGFGTERVEEEMRQLFPEARLARLDSDIGADRRKFMEILKKMHQGEIDILIGTQMIAKGHHFPNVTLVGVVWADGGMSIPDFRAAERTFQLLTQVIGRAGRGDSPGEVIIQTMRPDHYALQFAERHDYLQMYQREMEIRQAAYFPPFSRLILLRIQGHSEQSVQHSAAEVGRHCRKIAHQSQLPVQVFGPSPSPLDKIKDNYRWQVLLKGRSPGDLHLLCAELQKCSPAPVQSGCALLIDVDPENMM